MASRKKRERPTVSIIGSGRLGTALAIALSRSGYSVEALVARRRSSAQRAARQLDGKTVALAENQLDQLPDSRLIIIATPDDAIESVARKLAASHSQKAIVLHTSGALSSLALKPLSNRGFSTGSLHPLMAVSSRSKGVESWQGTFWCIEGDRAAKQAGRQIVNDLRGKSFSIKTDKKALYHAAAVMVSGHVVALFDLAVEVMVQSGLTRATAREVLLPLVQSNLRNLLIQDNAHALTGTFARGDVATVRRHLQAFAESGLPEALAVYKLLGDRSLSLAAKISADPQALKQIRKLLSNG